MRTHLILSFKIKEWFVDYLKSEGLNFDPSLDIDIRTSQFILQSGLLVQVKRENFDKVFDRCFGCSEKLKDKKEHIRTFYQGINRLLEDYGKKSMKKAKKECKHE